MEMKIYENKSKYTKKKWGITQKNDSFIIFYEKIMILPGKIKSIL